MLLVIRSLRVPQISWRLLWLKNPGKQIRKVPKLGRLTVLSTSALLLKPQVEDLGKIDCQKIVVETTTSVVDKSHASPWWQNVITILKVVFRTLQMTVLLTPLIVMAPFALYIDSLKDPWFQLLVKIIQECGPVYVKLGQWASTRQDIFPRVLCNHLSHLQRRANTHDWKHTQEILKENYGDRVADIFESFDETPIGSGCCAQVYKAKCRTGVSLAWRKNLLRKSIKTIFVLVLSSTVKKLLTWLSKYSTQISKRDFTETCKF